MRGHKDVIQNKTQFCPASLVSKSLCRMKNVLPVLDRMISTVFGIGYFPWAPGTMGSLAAVFVWWMLPLEPFFEEISGIFLAGVAGIYFSGRFSGYLGVRDPDVIVVDEFVGQFISLLWTEHDIIHGLTAFLFFRFLDIFKPGPIRWAERLPGGVGIMADDILAGCLAGVLTLELYRMMPA
uniref:Phosphatidylglycerophosphatase A n=4 Tax=Leptospirillum TaxID=179 RepID=A0A2I2MGC2_9BACT|nr:MAG: Putative phosphatidylglycerophosphatase A [Leptospirillum sp. Group II '5-way CG']